MRPTLALAWAKSTLPVAHADDDDERGQQHRLHAARPLPSPLSSSPHSTVPHSSSMESSGRVLVLTGSTGSLGNYLLDYFLREKSFDRIICLNRSKDAFTRQSRTHPQRGLSGKFPTGKVTFWKAEFDSDQLGLTTSQYQELLDDATHIVHNAWPVDFNRKISSFSASIRGAKNLIKLAHQCTHHCTFFFVSSMSTAANWARYSGLLERVPEMPLGDWRLARMGYGQSKLVVERMLQDVSQVEGMSVVVCRVGQVAGPVYSRKMGMWNKQEWLPSLIASSLQMGIIPETLGAIDQVDWIPVDVLAPVIGELLLASPTKTKSKSSKNGLQVYHALNPHLVRWSSVLLPAVMEKSTVPLRKVSIVDWIDQLQLASLQPNAEVKLPAVTLLSVFFDNLRDKALRFPQALSSPLDTSRSCSVSPTLRACRPVSPEWMQLWMGQWDFEGTLQREKTMSFQLEDKRISGVETEGGMRDTKV